MSEQPMVKIPYNLYIQLQAIAGMAGGMTIIEHAKDFNKEGLAEGLRQIRDMADEIYNNGEIIK